MRHSDCFPGLTVKTEGYAQPRISNGTIVAIKSIFVQKSIRVESDDLPKLKSGKRERFYSPDDLEPVKE
jgi:hypothetical protein